MDGQVSSKFDSVTIWRKTVVVLALLFVVVGAVVPDACADNLTTVASTSVTVARPHTSDQPFGCQHQEDCFCCAHIVPMTLFELHQAVVVAGAEQQQCISSVDQAPPAPYHPPKL